MSSKGKCSGRRVEFAMAVVGAGLVFLCAVALCAPMAGCARTGRAIGNFVQAVAEDFNSNVQKLAGPDKPQAVAAKEDK